MEYRPVRIIKLVQVHHTSATFLHKHYPHAIIEHSGKTFKAFYKPGSVVDTPNDSERKLFDTIKGAFVEIPQLTKVGLDDPASGVARSRKGAYRGKRNFDHDINSGTSESPTDKEIKEVKNNE